MDRLRIHRLKDQFFGDRRGYAFFPFQADLEPNPSGIDLSSLHIVKTMPGESRGNHEHPDTAEWLHFCGARAEIAWVENGELKKEILERDDTIIYIPKGVPHAIANIDSVPMILLAFREQKAKTPSLHTEPLPEPLL